MGGDDSAAAVLGLLSDPIRVDVLRAIAHAHHDLERPGVAHLSFSEIYERVDVDNTSKLSYHLGELVGTFVRKDDDGYSFTHAGEHVVRFILAENYEAPRDFGVNETAGICIFCEAEALEARVNHQMFLVECGACGRPNAGHGITPAQARERDWPALLRSIKDRHGTQFAQIRRSLCPMCEGKLDTEIHELSDPGLPASQQFVVVADCPECLRVYNMPLSYAAVYHPAAIAFHWDHGVDVTSRALWEFHEHAVVGRWTSERVSSDPDEYRVVHRAGDDELRVFFDAAASVTRTERVRR